VEPNEAASDVPTNAGCADEASAKMATKTVRFF
jgi:monothiol glutaredoxin